MVVCKVLVMQMLQNMAVLRKIALINGIAIDWAVRIQKDKSVQQQATLAQTN